MSIPVLTVVIPAYNEERRLGSTLDRLAEYARERGQLWEILVVDDGSVDGTVALAEGRAARTPGMRVLGLGVNRGKGAAVRAGMMEAAAPRVLFTDADLSTPVEELPALELALDRGADVAVGSRALDRGRIGVRQPLYRETAGRVFNAFVRLLGVSGIHDTQCGFKLFTASAGRRLFRCQKVPRFGFDVEVLFLARRAGLNIAEIPVRWLNSPETKVRPVRDGLRAFVDVALIRWYALKGDYRAL